MSVRDGLNVTVVGRQWLLVYGSAFSRAVPDVCFNLKGTGKEREAGVRVLLQPVSLNAGGDVCVCEM